MPNSVEVEDKNMLENEKAQGTLEAEKATEFGSEIVGGLRWFPCTISRTLQSKKDFYRRNGNFFM